MFFDGIKQYYEIDLVNGRNQYKYYLLVIYFLQVNTFLARSEKPGDFIMIDHFIEAFNGKDTNKIQKLISTSNEAVFIACMGLSQRINLLDRKSLKSYTSLIGVELNENVILQLLDNMKTNINNQSGDGFLGFNNDVAS